MPESQGFDSTVRQELIANAVIIDLPDQRFIERMKPHARQTMTYRLNTSCRGLGIELSMTAAGVVSAQLSYASVLFENGQARFVDGVEQMCWFDTGEEARVQTSLGRSHVRKGVTPEIVVDAFLGIFGVHRDAGVPDGYGHWMEAMQIYADYVATTADGSIQIVHQLPLMMPATMTYPEPGHAQPVVSNAATTVHDVSDLDDPVDMPEHLASVRGLQDRYSPVAMDLSLALPNLLFRKPHQEIFEAEPGSVSGNTHLKRLREHISTAGKALTA